MTDQEPRKPMPEISEERARELVEAHMSDPVHLFKIKVGDTVLGETVCGAESEKTGLEVCPECVEKGRTLPDFTYSKGTSDNTVNHMMVLIDWLATCRMVDLMQEPEQVLERYFEQSPLWSRVPPPEETDD